MSCQELVELVTDYLEGRLDPAEAERFEEHLGACAPCGIYVEQMRVTIRTLGRIPPETISAEARRELLHAFADWHTSAEP